MYTGSVMKYSNQARKEEMLILKEGACIPRNGGSSKVKECRAGSTGGAHVMLRHAPVYSNSHSTLPVVSAYYSSTG